MQNPRWHVKVNALALSAVALGLVAGLVLGLNPAVSAAGGGQTGAARGSVPVATPRSTRGTPQPRSRSSWASR
jgi:hypothetical protein